MARAHPFNCCGPCCEPREVFRCVECDDAEVSSEGGTCAECVTLLAEREEESDDLCDWCGESPRREGAFCSKGCAAAHYSDHA